MELTVAAPGILGNDSNGGGPLTAVVVAVPAHGSLVPHANGSFSYAPAPDFHGTDTFTYRASDGAQTSILATVTITVNPVNDRPTISDIADKSTPQNVASGAHDFTVGDVETAAGILTLAGSSSNQALVPNGGISFGGSGAARTVTVTPAAGQVGTATITLTVSDGSLTASDTFVLTVNPPVKTPTTTSTPTSSLPTSTYGQPVTFTATVSGAGGTPTGTVTFFDNAVTLGTATLNASRVASLTTSTVNAGKRLITAAYNGDSRFAASTSAAFTQTVNKAATTTTLAAPSPLQQQYSDRVALSATISVPGAAASVTFRIGTVALGTAPIDATGKASLNPQLLGSIGTGTKIVTATFNKINPNYTVTNPAGRSMSILRENARFAWPGPTTLSRNGGTTVRLTVQITDMLDGNPGSVGTASVAFINRATGATIGTATVVPNAKGTTGTATVTWTISRGTYTIGFSAMGQYIRNNTADNVVVTVTN